MRVDASHSVSGMTYSKPGFGVNANRIWNGYSQAEVEGRDITGKLFSFCFSAVLSGVLLSTHAAFQLFSFCFLAVLSKVLFSKL